MGDKEPKGALEVLEAACVREWQEREDSTI
jgi:hypothetical protein